MAVTNTTRTDEQTKKTSLESTQQQQPIPLAPNLTASSSTREKEEGDSLLHSPNTTNATKEASDNNSTQPIRPNIIFLYTDQQSAGMMGCAGNKWLKTPAMDYLAKNGIRFTRAYTTNPVCVAARIGMMTGRFASAIPTANGQPVRDNNSGRRVSRISDKVNSTTLGSWMKQSGYDLVYGGKEHLPKPLRPARHGFEILSSNEREQLARKAATYIQNPHDRPYFMWLNFINPHDICYMAIYGFPETEQEISRMKKASGELRQAMSLPKNVSQDEFFDKHCPPLPPNYEPQEDEPRAIGKLLDATDKSYRRKARESASERDWRRHRWAYARLTEMVDKQVQQVLDAVKASGQEENTLIIFSSDHGDMDASHRLEQKNTLYEEAANVPLLMMWKGRLEAGKVDSAHLVSNGLDLLPTFCDYAGLLCRSDPRGRSLRPLLEGRGVHWRQTLGVDSQIGRMVVSEDGYKYIRYDFDGVEEQLLDLNKDPREKTHFTNSEEHKGRLDDIRKAFQDEWFPITK